MEFNKEVMANILDDLFKSIIKDTIEENEQIFKKTIETIMNNEKIKYPKAFHDNFTTRLNDVLKTYFYKTLSQNDCIIVTKMSHLFMNYNFYFNNIKYIIIRRNGTSCSVDRTNWVIRMYYDYLKTNKIPNIPEDKKFFIPTFGTGEDWMGIMNSLYELYYGNPLSYLKYVKNLLINV